MTGQRTDELVALLTSTSWFVRILDVVADVAPPDWWVGAGVVRDVVWDTRFGDGFAPDRVKDVDVAYFDAEVVGADAEHEYERRLAGREPSVAWDVKNQAGVHLWYPQRFGVEVEPLTSTVDGIATWPELAVCVGVRLSPDGRMEVAAPHGLDDLLDGLWRRNPRRVTAEEYRARLDRKQPHRRWPAVRVIA